MATVASVGIIGGGRMGQAIARRLYAQGISVQVWNRTAERLQGLVAEGIPVASDLPDLLRAHPVWITVLNDGPVTRSVWSMPGGMAEYATPDKVWLQMGSIDYPTTLALAHEARRRGLRFLDAPVLGGPTDIPAGRLIVMAGGDEEVLEAVRPVLEALSGRIVPMGPVGTGTLAKLTSNLLLAHMVVGLAEWLSFGQQVGLDPLHLWEVVKHSKLYNLVFEAKFAAMLEENFQPSFALQWMAKDLWNILEAARQFGAYAPVAHTMAVLYQAAQNHGLGEDDYSAVYQVLRLFSRGT
ncbi:MAG: NAD(P)-dependent oxidoreductase [Acidobacteria bacterium]|nr:NAD(P)-dependent oxidoreductase [Acidobacteriota bacterium]MDW7984695.1 NAD(P)-dependent oxidoreductase [Acidobacteriota bacterium]